ncbi:MAG: transcriptional regulator [Devosia sp.]|nr:transcriptional regulator [Devosia sp.]
MPMKSPPHPGEGLRDDIEALGLTVAEAANGLGITRQQLNNILAGRSAITPETALRLEKAIGSTADHWLRLQAAYDLARLRGVELNVTRFTRKVA